MIKSHSPILDIFENQLLKEGVEAKSLESIKKEIDDKLNRLYETAKAEEKEEDVLRNVELNFNTETGSKDIIHNTILEPSTGINIERLKALGNAINTLPKNFNPHSTINKIYQSRLESIKTGEGVDWATAEALVWGVLLQEGKTVRISGQDVERGTFSHRHSVLHDQINYSKYRPLDLAANDTNNLQICLSPLSEYAVLGFELGFSYNNPDALVQWEAQFGDFANGAQVIIDQFISSGESKWSNDTSLVLLLPHGMDGQGPEHSSCRIERFLQLVDDHPFKFDWNDSDKNISKYNIQVCNPTTPSNYFHMLLRQVRRSFKKPLIVPTPKRLLRFKDSRSSLTMFSEGKSFEKVRGEIDDEINKNSSKVKLVLLCSGNVYYDLLLERQKVGRKDIAIVALEQVAPLPYIQLVDLTKHFTNASFKWVQEEHLNNGCWTYIQPRINTVIF